MHLQNDENQIKCTQALSSILNYFGTPLKDDFFPETKELLKENKENISENSEKEQEKNSKLKKVSHSKRDALKGVFNKIKNFLSK
ncbi:hypothetical protein [Holospora obtusa]|uniref:hypothetical protein n=1 Tax=Holospora obtusa TaxID=49893 RepID=UPI00042A781B|nr:hypothetical protein [Holospora obtusa]